VVGAVIGLIIAVGATIIPALLSGGRWVGLASTLWYFFYMLTNIAFVEELLLRGYIQTRLYGAIKSDIAAVIVGGVLFMGMHIPFQLYNRSGGDIVEFFVTNALWLITAFIMHLVLNLLYRKYNSLTAPTICHFVINFCSTLFG
jgi:membrane protease YdiL (CAAX protease family)